MKNLVLILVSILSLSNSNATVWTYTYPNNIVNGNDAVVKRSEKYEVTVSQNGESKDCYVMYDKNQAENVNANLAKNPDNHWTNFSVDGSAVQVKIKRVDGNALNWVNVFPSVKGYTATINGNTATITVPEGETKLQLFVEMNGLNDHPLFIFVDPKETDVPNINGADVEVVRTTDNIATVKNKLQGNKTYIYFEPGIHKWGNNTGAGYDGYKLPIKSGKKIYLAGGAYVIGSFASNGQSNWKVYGRGIISGAGLDVLQTAEFIPWSTIHHSGNGNNIKAEGFTSMCPPHFALTIRGECDIDNVKMMSWWYSTDGTITGDNSTVNNCFFKVNDDGIKVYGDNCSHDNNTMYHQTNGAPFQFAWTGQDGDNTISTNTYIVNSVYKGSLNGTSNTAVVNCREANKGQTIQDHIFDGIYIDNGCHRLLGLDATNGSLKNITIKNVHLNSGNKTNPQNGYSYLDNGTFSNIELCNVFVNGNLITGLDPNSDKPAQGKLFFKGQTGKMSFCAIEVCNIDTDKDGTNDCLDLCINDPNKIAPGNCGCGTEDTPNCGKITISDIDDLTFTQLCNEVILKWSDVDNETGYRVRRKITGDPTYTNIGDVAADVTKYTDETVEQNTSYTYMVRPLENDVAVAISNTQDVLIDLCNTTAITTFNYPTANGQAFASNYYDVFVKVGNDLEQQLQVLMSDVNYRTMYDGDWMKNENKDRTFSFVQLDYDKTEELTFRVVKKFGNNSNSAVLSPKSYGYTPTITKANELTFTMNGNEKYLSINFEGNDNESPSKAWIKNMLCIFVDPPETDAPDKTGNGVVTYGNNVNATTLSNASVIYFPKGYHNLRDFNNGGLINNDGVIKLKTNQSIYLEGGTFVEGIIQRTNYGDENQRIYGRGILTGRQYYWKNHPNHSGPQYGELIQLGKNSEVKGIMYMESPNHGLVAPNTHVENVKFLGWHSNHDGIRVGSGSEIENCFLRAVDDHFYNFNIHVHDCVIWAGHNGAILTYGWGGEQGSNNYNAGSSLIENIDIINPEWTGLGNNNGLIMSQQGYNHPVVDYGTGDTTTIIRNIRVEGTIPGITNLKPRSSGNGNIAVQVAENELSFLGDLVLENISVEAVFDKGLIRGEANPTFNGNSKWLIKDVLIKNVSIGGNCISDANKNDYFDIDYNTIQNVVFDCGGTPPIEILPVNTWDNIFEDEVLSGTVEIQTLAHDGNYGLNHGDGIKQINFQVFDMNDLTTQLDFFPISANPYTWELNTTNYPNGNYQIRSGAVSLDAGETKWTVINITIDNTITATSTSLYSDVQIYPNPAQNTIHITGKLTSWQLIDLTGRILQSNNTNEVDISNFKSGVFLLIVDGIVHRVVKE